MMSSETYRHRINAFAIIVSSAFAGANLFIGLSMGTWWLSLDSITFMAGFWAQFISFTLTIIPLFLATLVGLVLSARLDWRENALRRLWLIAIGLYVATSLITIVYHMPVNLTLRAGELSIRQADAARLGWLLWNVPRILLAFAIPVYALRAVVARRDVAV